MSASETVPILVNASVGEADLNCALSVSESSTEEIHLPDIAFEPALDSPGLNRESQPLLGGLDVSFNHFQGASCFVICFIVKKFLQVCFVFFLLQMILLSLIWSGRPKSPSITVFFRKEFHKVLVVHTL